MTQRLNYRDADRQAIRGMFAIEEAARQSGLEDPLLELVRMRASQINGCAYCMYMHAKDARAEGWNRLAISFRAPVGSYARAG